MSGERCERFGWGGVGRVGLWVLGVDYDYLL